VLSLYFLPEVLRVALSVCCALSVMACALAFVMSLYRFRQRPLYLTDCLLALSALCQTVLCTALVAWTQNSFFDGFVVEAGMTLLRYLLASVGTLLSVYSCIKGKQAPPITTAASAILILPVAEKLTS